ncbi:hypothetical protein AURDEDRAFT_131231 [Auricularia subglabra TFB-10046 SS5]|uniref:CxC2-like cysteine cluster KDZ transposase-associated domain-containing protein n=1 Tax=Auricularia subglabra (strain TFB-10046 / SS5) TaxID=717982 RepID=J0LCS1_AURST|nr:hypothetical protein AURDEDRAFT_131231 [Auricularia subglabra TFB-10046 SS5]
MCMFFENLKSNALDVPKSGAELPPGSMATLCASCPQPGINMDPNWKSRPDYLKYLDAKISMRDGNFPIGQKDKRLDPDDMPLTLKAMYFLHQGEMRELMKDKFVNVDFAVVSSHHAYLDIPMFIEVHDIVCKWWTNFRQCIAESKLINSEFTGVAALTRASHQPA